MWHESYMFTKIIKYLNIVWLKRDLRLNDHPPLASAVKSGKDFGVVFIFEPSIQNYPDWNIRHWRFAYQSLMDLCERGLPISIYYGEAIDVFKYILATQTISCLYSHEEVGNNQSFKRDQSLKKFFLERNIKWVEFPTGGIIRGKKDRVGWRENWKYAMSQKIEEIHWDSSRIKNLFVPECFKIPPHHQIQLGRTDQKFQLGGETEARKLLFHFLHMHHYKDYNKNISKPEESRQSCSRLSPYLAWGNISIRQVVQEIEKLLFENPPYKRQLLSFYSRIQWNQHFIQKFESESRIETQNLNRAFDLLDKPVDEKKLEAWQTGMTGVPLVDASMRALKHTGYLNFRMRALLVSFLTHHLWQPWQSGAYHLAQLFLDYEPGIHYPQFQMQTGTTGVNTLRIYNPTKNAIEHDPEALFIKKWVPELKSLPARFAIEPWRLSYLEQKFYNVELGEHYPTPIVNIQESPKKALKVLWEFKRNPDVIAENQRILQKHTFRKTTDDQRPLFIK